MLRPNTNRKRGKCEERRRKPSLLRVPRVFIIRHLNFILLSTFELWYSAFAARHSTNHWPRNTMKKVHQPHFPMFSCFTLPTDIFTPVAHIEITRKTGCIFTIFTKTHDLEFVRAITHFRPPVSFEKNTVFAQSLPMAPLNFSQCILGNKSPRRKKSLPPVAGFKTRMSRAPQHHVN
jgi:hypothetical protein